jgi:hypothetical protein
MLGGNMVLEYADGTHAGISSGTFLHHAVIFNLGRERRIAKQCGGPLGGILGPSLFLGGGSETTSQLPYAPPDGSLKSGYHVLPSDKFSMVVEVMNYANVRKEVYVVADIDVIDGENPDWLDIHTFVLSLEGCKTDPGFSLTSRIFNASSRPIPIPMTGIIINGVGHLHDGGAKVDIFINNKLICNSIAKYGAEEQYIAPGQSKQEPWQTIAGMNECEMHSPISAGDLAHINVEYNLDQHPMRMNSMHKAEKVMGVGAINIAAPYSPRYII